MKLVAKFFPNLFGEWVLKGFSVDTEKGVEICRCLSESEIEKKAKSMLKGIDFVTTKTVDETFFWV